MRRAKIVCTLGPASLKPEVLEELLNAGMDVARLNFSHGSHAQHAQTLSMLRTASLKVRKAVGVLGALQGPKVRTGKLVEGKVELGPGAPFPITPDETVAGTQEIVSTTYPFLASDVNPGDS